MTVSGHWIRRAAAVFTALLVFATPAAGALSDDDNACLGCHAQEGLTKQIGKGETLQLQVDGAAFERSVHAPLGCAACHSDVDLKSHPGAVKEYASRRAYTLFRAETCQQCHEDAAKQHEGSVHMKRIRDGNLIAPTCTGCHSAHAVTPKTAYDTCVRCHFAALAAHGKWLPNAARHHETVSCAACHATGSARMVDLRLYDPATQTWAVEKPGAPWFEKLAKSVDGNGDGFDARELLELVRRINPDGTAVPKAFRGRIELQANAEAHRLLEKAGAIRACDSCHRAGAEPFRRVTVSVAGPDGRPIRHPAHPEILSAATSVVALPEFYAIGGTRSTLLDVLFVLALLGGISFPIVHFTVRWLLKKFRA
jgi:hypothetical protein